MNLQPRPCKQCGDKIAEYGRLRCFSCLHPELPPPTCKACGSDAHYVGGYCRRCHPRVPYADSCSDCLAWGTWHRHGRCAACTSLRNRGHETGTCATCRRTVPLLKHGVCRLCRCQAQAVPRTWQRPDSPPRPPPGSSCSSPIWSGGSTFAARTRERGSPEAHQHTGLSSWAMPRWRQEPLFIAERDMSRVTVPDVEPIDPTFTAYVSVQAEASAEAQAGHRPCASGCCEACTC
ncbi:hypothetical protein NKH18_02430 [Streptomyces sp. M10(2022)]